MPNHVNNNSNTASKHLKHVVEPECCIPLLELFCLDYACQVSKTCLAMIENHLELFSAIFGANFCIQVIAKFCFKNNSPKLGF